MSGYEVRSTKTATCTVWSLPSSVFSASETCSPADDRGAFAQPQLDPVGEADGVVDHVAVVGGFDDPIRPRHGHRRRDRDERERREPRPKGGRTGFHRGILASNRAAGGCAKEIGRRSGKDRAGIRAHVHACAGMTFVRHGRAGAQCSDASSASAITCCTASSNCSRGDGLAQPFDERARRVMGPQVFDGEGGHHDHLDRELFANDGPQQVEPAAVGEVDVEQAERLAAAARSVSAASRMVPEVYVE